MVSFLSKIRNYMSQSINLAGFLICLMLLAFGIAVFTPQPIICTTLSILFGSLLMLALQHLFGKLAHQQTSNLISKNSKSESTNIDNQKSKAEIDQLEVQINNLKCSQVKIQQFEEIEELSLLSTNFSQTTVYNEKIGEIRTNLLGQKFYDQLLIVSNHDVKANLGIDFKNIRIKKTGESAICVSGIKPKVTGITHNIVKTSIKEIREITLDKNENVKAINIKNDKATLLQVDKLVEERNNEYQESLTNIKNLDYLDDIIVVLAKKFIKIIFAATYGENIDFCEEIQEDALPMLEFTKQEIRNVINKKQELEVMLLGN